MQSLRVTAPAKLNIGLRVLPGTRNGYHAIESLFQMVSLFDTLVIQYGEDRRGSGKGRCIVECGSMALPETNTLTRAYDSFCALTGICADVDVGLEKHIPSGAGLGGGSSDAAAFIKALDALYETRLSSESLMRIAGEVGSDVFFFLSCDKTGSGCAVVTGRGEQVRQIAPRQNLFFVLICPKVHSSTEEAYRLIDEYFASGETQVYPELSSFEAAYQGPVQNWKFINSFTEPVTRKYPQIAEAIADLKLTGALYTQMSGSGSAVFGVFESSIAARYAASQLAQKWERTLPLFPV
ncbi:MAG: 4-(cytidine 5'-diphospho)-2-C-methyl-D-erythritol kinase [Treponema sp.]|jgi:4-diphosphocytidyl-2-C-methyl-D-erythritol kinase|nr:4-(cytidine 5'-diphospho)-2-C-methyl-D-erythritol kinase [Treponema sp.]